MRRSRRAHFGPVTVVLMIGCAWQMCIDGSSFSWERFFREPRQLASRRRLRRFRCLLA